MKVFKNTTPISVTGVSAFLFPASFQPREHTGAQAGAFTRLQVKYSALRLVYAILHLSKLARGNDLSESDASLLFSLNYILSCRYHCILGLWDSPGLGRLVSGSE